MLVFTHKVGEKAVIVTPEGRRIEVVLTQAEGDGKCRIGYVADRAVQIDREKVALAKAARCSA